MRTQRFDLGNEKDFVPLGAALSEQRKVPALGTTSRGSTAWFHRTEEVGPRLHPMNGGAENGSSPCQAILKLNPKRS